MAEISVQLPRVILGVLEAEELQVAAAGPELTQLLETVASSIQKKLSVATLAEAEPSRAVRAIFRDWGVDPSEYRPSSEALLRRIVQGKGIYRVSNVVDIGNLGSDRDSFTGAGSRDQKCGQKQMSWRRAASKDA